MPLWPHFHILAIVAFCFDTPVVEQKPCPYPASPLWLQPVLSGPEEVTCFLEALQLSEYTIAFADVLGVVPMSVCEVRESPARFSVSVLALSS